MIAEFKSISEPPKTNGVYMVAVTRPFMGTYSGKRPIIREVIRLRYIVDGRGPGEQSIVTEKGPFWREMFATPRMEYDHSKYITHWDHMPEYPEDEIPEHKKMDFMQELNGHLEMGKTYNVTVICNGQETIGCINGKEVLRVPTGQIKQPANWFGKDALKS